MARTLLLGAEIALPTTTGTATSFSQATAVRLVNDSSTARLVTVVETQSGDVVGSMTLPGNSVEIIEKQYTHCVFAANAAVKGAKVGFTA
jgi:hypothetical protein|tara:strand:+ start:13362 stop:13631 length:270 start_codon:yes stop_codon:yes gene_type:complete